MDTDQETAGVRPLPEAVRTVARESLRDCGRIAADTGRLVVRHWPVLIALAVVGGLAEDKVIDLAVRVSTVDTMASWLVLFIAPLCMLAAFVAMLRVMRPSLREVPPRATEAGGRRQAAVGALAEVASLLVPFLAVYELSGMLNADIHALLTRIQNDMVSAEIEQGLGGLDVGGRLMDGRGQLDFGPSLLVVAVVAFAARWLLAKFGAANRRVVPAVLAAYLETVWITLVMRVGINLLRNNATDWLQQRRITVWAEDLWASWGDLWAPLAWVHNAVSEVAGLVLDSADRVLLMPLAWIAVATVVYGRTPPPEPAEEADGAGGEGEPGRSGSGRRAAEDQATRRWLSLAVRKFLFHGRRAFHLRFGALVRALRQIWRTGLVPALAFCLAFLSIWSMQTLLVELERLVVGPRPVRIWFGLSDVFGPVNTAITLAVLMALVAAATDRILRVDPQPEGSGDEEDAGTGHPEAGHPEAGHPEAGDPEAGQPDVAEPRPGRSVAGQVPEPAAAWPAGPPVPSVLQGAAAGAPLPGAPLPGAPGPGPGSVAGPQAAGISSGWWPYSSPEAARRSEAAGSGE